jgi:hypothetical protein
MRRALQVGLTVVAGVFVGWGCATYKCDDCDCGDGPFQVTGTVNEADRAELVGATVSVQSGGVIVGYTRTDGSTWQVDYNASEAP